MRIAVTGASGHIGSNLVPMLIEQGHDVVILQHRSHEWTRSWDVTTVEGDVTRKETLYPLIDGMDVVINLAANINLSSSGNGQTWEVNAGAVRHLTEVCLDEKVKRFIQFSTIHVFDPFPQEDPLDEKRKRVVNPPSQYEASKLDAEKFVAEAIEKGLDAVLIAPTSCIGPNDYFPSLLGQAVIDIYNGKLPALVPGGYDFVDVRDVARGTLQAIKKGKTGETYLLSGRYLTIRDLAGRIGEAGNIKAPRLVMSGVLLKAFLPLFKLHGYIMGKPPVLTGEAIQVLLEGPKDVRSTKAERELGYSKRPFKETVKDTIEWFRAGGRLKH